MFRTDKSKNEEVIIERKMKKANTIYKQAKMSRFMICDDDPNITSSINNLVKKVSNELDICTHVDTCYNGIECLYRIYDNYKKQKKYDILLLDENMPGISGSFLIRILQTMIEDKELNAIKIFSTTSFENDSFKKTMNSMGIYGFLPKPINKKDIEELLKLI